MQLGLCHGLYQPSILGRSFVPSYVSTRHPRILGWITFVLDVRVVCVCDLYGEMCCYEMLCSVLPYLAWLCTDMGLTRRYACLLYILLCIIVHVSYVRYVSHTLHMRVNHHKMDKMDIQRACVSITHIIDTTRFRDEMSFFISNRT